MIGFLCTTPYHLLISLSMALNEFHREDKILVVFGRFSDADILCERIRSLNIFVGVILLDSHDFDCLKNWNRRLRMFYFYKKFSNISKSVIFDQFIFFAPDLLEVSFMVKKIVKYSPNCKFSFAEDGIGSYLTPLIYEPTYKMQKWLKILHRDIFLKKITGLFLLHPELIAYQTSYHLQKILPLDLSNSNFDVAIKNIWKKNNLVETDLLFLQQPFHEDHKIELAQKQNELLDSIIRYCSSRHKKLGVKLHPRTRLFPYENQCNIIDANDMYELEIKDSKAVKCIIGINSGALLTPFLLWEKTIPIIFLYKLCGIKSLNSSMNHFLILFKENYEKKGGRFYVPSNYDELFAILKDVSNGD